jgi:hypothetical protein
VGRENNVADTLGVKRKAAWLMRRAPQAVGVVLFLLYALLALSCATAPSPGSRAAARPGAARLSPEAVRLQGNLVEGGRYVLGKKELVIRGRRFNLDCTGTVLAIYYYAGIDLSRDFDKYSGNGVSRLYRSLDSERLVYRTLLPVPGDIIFWDNTYDRNGDGRWNDPLTHVGMVMETREDGTIAYVHLNYHNGIIIEHMNLRDPQAYQKLVRGEIRVVNSPIRLQERGRPHPDKWLSGQLYRSFAMGYLF